MGIQVTELLNVRVILLLVIIMKRIVILVLSVRNLRRLGPEGFFFAFSGLESTAYDNLIQGTCFINNISLITIIDTSATHLFISVECVKILKLEMYTMIA